MANPNQKIDNSIFNKLIKIILNGLIEKQVTKGLMKLTEEMYDIIDK